MQRGASVQTRHPGGPGSEAGGAGQGGHPEDVCRVRPVRPQHQNMNVIFIMRACLLIYRKTSPRWNHKIMDMDNMDKNVVIHVTKKNHETSSNVLCLLHD